MKRELQEEKSKKKKTEKMTIILGLYQERTQCILPIQHMQKVLNIFKENITKMNTVCHSNHEDNSISNLYLAKYTVKRNHTDVQNLADNRKIAFELTEDEINNILKNKDEPLNLAVRMFFSENNVKQYINNKKLGDRHIGYLKDTNEGYRILLASNTSVTHLNSLNLELVNNNNRNSIYGENDETR